MVAATDRIEFALRKLEDAADYIKAQYARTSAQWAYAEDMSNSARIALEQLGSLHLGICIEVPHQPDDGYIAESCYCAATNYPPCSWCTRDTRLEL